MGQLPSGAVGTAVGVLIYSIICLAASSMMIWLTWHHRERVSCMCYLPSAGYGPGPVVDVLHE